MKRSEIAADFDRWVAETLKSLPKSMAEALRDGRPTSDYWGTGTGVLAKGVAIFVVPMCLREVIDRLIERCAGGPAEEGIERVRDITG